MQPYEEPKTHLLGQAHLDGKQKREERRDAPVCVLYSLFLLRHSHSTRHRTGIMQWELLPSLAAEGSASIEGGLEDGVNAATCAGYAVRAVLVRACVPWMTLRAMMRVPKSE